jgi:hypothetical protein
MQTSTTAANATRDKPFKWRVSDSLTIGSGNYLTTAQSPEYYARSLNEDVAVLHIPALV